MNDVMAQIPIDYQLDQQFTNILRNSGVSVYGHQGRKRIIQREILEKALEEYVETHRRDK